VSLKLELNAALNMAHASRTITRGTHVLVCCVHLSGTPPDYELIGTSSYSYSHCSCAQLSCSRIHLSTSRALLAQLSLTLLVRPPELIANRRVNICPPQGHREPSSH